MRLTTEEPAFAYRNAKKRLIEVIRKIKTTREFPTQEIITALNSFEWVIRQEEQIANAIGADERENGKDSDY